MHRSRQKRRQMDDVYTFTCLSNSRKARNSCIPYSMPEKELIDILLTVIQSHADVVLEKSLKLRKNSPEIEAKRNALKTELSALRKEADKSRRMSKSLYESLASSIITPDEYREMRDNYETTIRENLARIVELENQQTEFDRQISDYCEIADLISRADKSGITAQLIDCLADKIKIYYDRTIEVEFKFSSGFEMISGVIENG
jgi:chromosome segregation ATPase